LSDDDNNERKESVGEDGEGKGASSAEPIAPNLISSGMAGQTHTSAADRVATTIALGSGHKRKHCALAAKRKTSRSSADQVMTQLEPPPYRGSRRPLDLVAIKIIFGRLFKAF
jgi:hypothetical protein